MVIFLRLKLLKRDSEMMSCMQKVDWEVHWEILTRYLKEVGRLDEAEGKLPHVTVIDMVSRSYWEP